MIAYFRAVDPWDVLGLASLAAVTLGVRALAGWPWALICIGGAGLVLYVVREVSLATPRGRG